MDHLKMAVRPVQANQTEVTMEQMQLYAQLAIARALIALVERMDEEHYRAASLPQTTSRLI